MCMNPCSGGEQLGMLFQSASLLTDTETYEDWERRLVEDCCHQLG